MIQVNSLSLKNKGGPLKLFLLIFCDGDKLILLRFFWFY